MGKEGDAFSLNPLSFFETQTRCMTVHKLHKENAFKIKQLLLKCISHEDYCCSSLLTALSSLNCFLLRQNFHNIKLTILKYTI